MKQKWNWVHIMSQYSPTPLADKLIDEWNNTCATTEMIADRDLSYLCSPCCDNNDKKRESHQNKTKLEIDWRNKWAPTKGRGKSVLLEIHQRRFLATLCFSLNEHHQIMTTRFLISLNFVMYLSVLNSRACVYADKYGQLDHCCDLPIFLEPKNCTYTDVTF